MQALAQQRAGLGAPQQQAAAARPAAAAAATPRPCAAPSSSSSSFGSGRARPSSSSTRLAPVCARRQRDPIVVPVIQMGPPGGEEVVDLYGYLLRNRIIFLNQRVDDGVATSVVASLLALDSLDPEAEIKLYINCSAGSPYAVTSILDTIDAIKAPVSTVAFGIVGGTAAAVLAAGAKGRRFSMASTRILLQQPMGGLQGSADECNITASELNRNMQVFYQFLARYTGLPVETVEMECDRDNFLSAEQAIALGLIDGVIN